MLINELTNGELDALIEQKFEISEACSDLNSAALVLDRLGELGKSTSSNPEDHPWMMFVGRLAEILAVEWRNGSIGAGQAWALINANPRQLMEAAYSAVFDWESRMKAV